MTEQRKPNKFLLEPVLTVTTGVPITVKVQPVLRKTGEQSKIKVEK